MDRERIERFLKEAERSLEVMEVIASLTPDEFVSDVRNRYTLRMAVVEVVEALIAASVRILREVRGVAVQYGYVEVARKLAEEGLLPEDDAVQLERLVRLRNLITHRYWQVDDRRIHEEAKANGIEAIRRIIGELRGLVLGGRGEA